MVLETPAFRLQNWVITGSTRELSKITLTSTFHLVYAISFQGTFLEEGRSCQPTIWSWVGWKASNHTHSSAGRSLPCLLALFSVKTDGHERQQTLQSLPNLSSVERNKKVKSQAWKCSCTNLWMAAWTLTDIKTPQSSEILPVTSSEVSLDRASVSVCLLRFRDFCHFFHTPCCIVSFVSSFTSWLFTLPLWRLRERIASYEQHFVGFFFSDLRYSTSTHLSFLQQLFVGTGVV